MGQVLGPRMNDGAACGSQRRWVSEQTALVWKCGGSFPLGEPGLGAKPGNLTPTWPFILFSWENTF